MFPEIYDVPQFAPVAELIIGLPAVSRTERRKKDRSDPFKKAGPKQQLPKRRKYHKGGHNKPKRNA